MWTDDARVWNESCVNATHGRWNRQSAGTIAGGADWSEIRTDETICQRHIRNPHSTKSMSPIEIQHAAQSSPLSTAAPVLICATKAACKPRLTRGLPWSA